MTTNYMSSQSDSAIQEPMVVTLTPEPSLLHTCIHQPTRPYNRRKPFPLSNLADLKIQQGLVIKDLLFSLLGYEGSYIRYSERYDASNADNRVQGPDFKIAKHLDISLKTITKSLVRYGKFYSGLAGFLELYDQSKYGRIIQKLCFAISQFLQKYRKVVIEVEHQFIYNAAYNLNILENTMKQELGTQLIHLYDIVIRIHQDTVERQALFNQNKNDANLSNFFQTIQNDLQQTGSIELSTDSNKFESCKGGLVLKIVQSEISSYKGDPISLQFLTSLFDSISIDYVDMLNKWLMNGEIDDPFEEFLIKQNGPPEALTHFFHSNMEKYWDELYMSRVDGLVDQFESKQIQLKLLSTGKFLNIFKTCAELDNFDNLNESMDPIHSLFAQDLELKIEYFYQRANKLFLKLIFEGYNFRGVVDYLQSAYLFKDCSKIDTFLDRSYNDLRRSKYTIPTSRLIASYNNTFHAGAGEFSVIQLSDSSNTPQHYDEILSQYETFSIDTANFYDLAKEIININSFDAEAALRENSSSTALKTFLNKALGRDQLDSAQSPASGSGEKPDPDHSDDYTMAAVSLDLNLPFPLNLIVTENYIFEYKLIFKLQVIIKFIDKLIDNTWKEMSYSSVWKYSKFNHKIKKWILRCRILHNRMRDFINELQSYVNYEIIEANYQGFKDYMTGIEINLQKSETDSSNVNNPARGKNTNGFPRFHSSHQRFSHHNKSSSLNFTNNQNNSLFDEKISAQSNKNFSGTVGGRMSHLRDGVGNNATKNRVSTELVERDVDVYKLINKLGSFLNNVLKDSLITNKVLIDSLKSTFDVIISYNNYLSRLKKSLIMIDHNLFNQFSENYPDKFANKSIDQNSINARFDSLNSLLNSHFELFNQSLTELIGNLKSHAEFENQSFSMLIDRLERCFPDRQ